MNKVCRHVYLSGKVQGVGFRAFVRRNAQRLGLSGWVKNLQDGRVEAVIYGEEKKVKDLISRMKTGPSLARVEDYEISELDKPPAEKDFQIRY